MPNPGMEPMGSVPPPPPAAPQAPMTPQVHTMPDRFRSTGSGGPKGGSSSTKKLVIALVVVIVVAGLGLAGLYVFNNVLTKANTNNTNNANTENTNAVANDNLNANTNLNTNLNTNADTNANSNANANANANTNAATNANSNTNVSTNSNANTNTSVSSNTPLPSTVDTDHDGLTDIEEQAYTTDVNNADTDGDGFVDGKQTKADGTIAGELYQGYNPKGTGTLEASSIVKRVTNSTKTFSVLVPTSWTTSSDSTGGLLITPSLQNGEFFQIRTADNPTQLAPKVWYQQNNPSADVTGLKSVTVNGLEGVVSEDGSTVYLFKADKIYSLQYGTGSLTAVNYWTTFEMIQHSFKLGA